MFLRSRVLKEHHVGKTIGGTNQCNLILHVVNGTSVFTFTLMPQALKVVEYLYSEGQTFQVGV